MHKFTLFRSWLSKQKLILPLPFMVLSIVFVIFWIHSYDFTVFFHIMVLVLFCSLLFFLLDFLTYLGKVKNLEHVSLTPPLNFPETKDIQELAYQKMLQELTQEIMAVNQNYNENIQNSNDYYVLWTHQIKTPLMAAKLLLQQDVIDPEALKMELFKMEHYIDMALGYQRLYSIEADFSFEEHSISSLVKDAVKSFSAVFLHQKTKLSIGNLNGTVTTDQKWFIFVLEQVISNALKYAVGGEISIYTKNDMLVIEDTGIGIKPEYLPRIFERGFTGGIGRVHQRSTGIGLYLCREILHKLSLTIKVESQHKVGTKVFITLTP